MTISRKSLFPALLFLLLVTQLWAGNKPQYAVSAIPKELLTGANAVLRTKEVVFERKSVKRATLNIHYVMTVLNKAGKNNGVFVQAYNRFSTITQIRGTVYNKEGKKIKTIKQDDIGDMVADLGASLYTDTRLKYIDPDYDHYPYTVEYSCQIDYSSLLNIPSWHVYESYKLAIQEEHFKLITHDNNQPDSPLAIRYYPNDKSINIKKEMINGSDAKNAITIYSYSVKNLKAVQDEIFSKSLSQCTPVVYFAPVKFVVAGFNGGFETWDDFGNFIRLLNHKRDALPEETRVKIAQMTAADTSIHEKVETLYQYMQDKVHYISISKGIQGWQPMPAAKVDELNYGDCKALTNYMKSLLEAAGVKSYYTLVYAGTNVSDIRTTFPSNQFNHAILCVPDKKDTLWLECTNQHIPCGYLGDFTDDRDVLVVSDFYSFLAHTPVYGPKQNVKNRKTDVTIQPDGTCNMDIHTSYSGIFYDENLPLLLTNDEKKKQALLSTLHLPTIQLKRYNFREDKGHTQDHKPLPLIHADIKITAAHYATGIGNLFIIKLYPFSTNNSTNIRYHQRHNDIVIRRGYSVSDTIVFHIPVGMTVAKLPVPKKLTTKFGDYSYSVTKQSDSVVYVRKLRINKGEYPPSDNQDFLAFLRQKADMDNVKFVLSY